MKDVLCFKKSEEELRKAMWRARSLLAAAESTESELRRRNQTSDMRICNLCSSKAFIFKRQRYVSSERNHGNFPLRPLYHYHYQEPRRLNGNDITDDEEGEEQQQQQVIVQRLFSPYLEEDERIGEATVHILGGEGRRSPIPLLSCTNEQHDHSFNCSSPTSQSASVHQNQAISSSSQLISLSQKDRTDQTETYTSGVCPLQQPSTEHLIIRTPSLKYQPTEFSSTLQISQYQLQQLRSKLDELLYENGVLVSEIEEEEEEAAAKP